MKTTDQLYEELRAVIVELQALAATRTVVGYALYDIEHGGSRQLIWADQYESGGDPTKTLVVPLAAA